MHHQKRWLIGIFFVLLSVTTNSTQIEFRSREIQPQTSDYNFKVGNLALDLRYAVGIIYDDNTNRSNKRSSRQEGTKIGNALTLNVDWPINRHLHIQTGLRVGYVFFAEGEGTDGVIVSGTQGDVAGKIAFDAKVGKNGLFTFEEKLARSVDTVEIDRVDNSEDFSLWHNTLSLQYQNQLSRFMNLAAKAAWRKTWSSDSDFEFRDNSAYIIDSIILSQINSQIQAGPFVRFVRYEYDERARPRVTPTGTNNSAIGFRHPDTDNFEAGVNVRYQISATTLASLSVAYQELFVDEDSSDTPPGVPIINDEDDGISIAFSLHDKLSDFVNHRLLASYRRNPGTSPTINYSEDIDATYNVSWHFVRDWELIGQFTWLKTNESSRAGEIADVFINLAGLRYHISPRSNVSLDYRRTEKFSNRRQDQNDPNSPGRDYERNEIRFLFSYDF